MSVDPAGIVIKQARQLIAGQSALALGIKGGDPTQGNRAIARRQLAGAVEQRDCRETGFESGAGLAMGDQGIGRGKPRCSIECFVRPFAVLQFPPRQAKKLPNPMILRIALRRRKQDRLRLFCQSLIERHLHGSKQGGRVSICRCEKAI